jgi:hypothetical protein
MGNMARSQQERLLDAMRIIESVSDKVQCDRMFCDLFIADVPKGDAANEVPGNNQAHRFCV